MKSEISILLLGEIDRPEFIGARSTLESLGRVSCFTKVEPAVEVLAAGEIVPDVIVIAQAFSRRFSHQTIDRLRRLAPLSRILGLLGSWCEGEIRSGQPWPGAVRIYWHQWHVRIQRELGRLVESRCPSWGLPVTATEEERLLRSTAQKLPRRHGLVAIHARRFEMEDWLAAVCRMYGYSTVWLRPSNYTRVEGAAAAIFDGSDLRGEELEQLRRFSDTLGRTPVVVLLDFPRIEDQRRAVSAGAEAVMSKPIYIDDLMWELEQITRSSLW